MRPRRGGLFSALSYEFSVRGRQTMDEWLERQHQIQALTTDETIRGILFRAGEIESAGEAHFVIRGGARWTSESFGRFHASEGDLWIQAAPAPVAFDSTYLTPRGLRREAVRPGETTTHHHEIWVGIATDMKSSVDTRDLDLATRLVSRVTLLADLISFRYQSPVTWFPARPGRWAAAAAEPDPKSWPVPGGWCLVPVNRSKADVTTTTFTDDNVNTHLLPDLANFDSIEHDGLASTLRTALNWHAQGNVLSAGLNRILNYWSSMELAANFLWKRLPQEDTKRLEQSAREEAVMHILKTRIERRTCRDLVMRCAEIVRPTARSRMKALSPWVMGWPALERLLFLDKVDGRSLKELRDDVAHGEISQHRQAHAESAMRRIESLRHISAQTICRLMRNHVELSDRLSPGS